MFEVYPLRLAAYGPALQRLAHTAYPVIKADRLPLA